MTYQFCTLFDSFYATRGLAMYQSLRDTRIDFKLYILCFDEASYDCVSQLRSENLVAIALTEFETPELLAVKPSRSIAEYCWTCTSSLIYHCITHFDLTHCTYLDADLYFFNSPKSAIDEASEYDVIITPHWYTPKYDQAVVSGKYCVQMMYFKANENGMKVLTDWKNDCIDWCFAEPEDGKFGDQKYLDVWTTKYKRIYDHPSRALGLAPWNIQQYSENKNGEMTLSATQEVIQPVFYHFHAVRFYEDGKVLLSDYTLPNFVVNKFYKPYLKKVQQQLNILQGMKSNVPRFKSEQPRPVLLSRIKASVKYGRNIKQLATFINE